MASISAVKEALKAGDRIVKDEASFPGVHTVMRGTKKTGGVDTGRPCVVFLVTKKRSPEELGEQVIPSAFRALSEDVETDVVEAPIFKAQQSPRGRFRPAPGGVSYGHIDITAGTLGGWAKLVGGGDSFYALTNAHVAADTNRGEPGDRCIQPGPFDGGRNPSDELGLLASRVALHMGFSAPTGSTCPEGPPPPPPDDGKPGKKGSVARIYWGAAKFAINAIPKLTGCPYRAAVINEVKLARRNVEAVLDEMSCIPQPWPNLVDAAIAGPVGNGLVDTGILGGTRPIGIRDPDVGDPVFKSGRTTGRTVGTIVGMEATSQVSYGEDGTALFEDQIIIEGVSGDFSAGGDSGSWITDDADYLVGLLFAGGGGLTIGNKITNVFSLLGLRL